MLFQAVISNNKISNSGYATPVANPLLCTASLHALYVIQKALISIKPELDSQNFLGKSASVSHLDDKAILMDKQPAAHRTLLRSDFK